jgi:hypothetical protein
MAYTTSLLLQTLEEIDELFSFPALDSLLTHIFPLSMSSASPSPQFLLLHLIPSCSASSLIHISESVIYLFSLSYKTLLEMKGSSSVEPRTCHISFHKQKLIPGLGV